MHAEFAIPYGSLCTAFKSILAYCITEFYFCQWTSLTKKSTNFLCGFSVFFSRQALAVDLKLENHAELGAGGLAELHADKENFKIIHNRAYLGIDDERKADHFFILEHVERRFLYRIVYAVVDIESIGSEASYARGTNVRFIGDDKRGGDMIYRHGGMLIMISDSTDDQRRFVRIDVKVIEYTEGHQRARLRVIDAVDNIADVMHISCDLGKLYIPLGIAELLKDISRALSYLCYVGKTVLGKAELSENIVCLADIGIYLLILLYLFVCQHSFFLFYY